VVSRSSTPTTLQAIIDRARSRPKHRVWTERLISILFCAFFLAELLFSVRHLSQTVDEPVHLYTAYRYVRCGDLTLSPEHPPFAKVIAITPLLFMDFDLDCTPRKLNELEQFNASLDWLYAHDWRRGLQRARMAISIFAVGLYALTWMIARRMFGLRTAVMASALFVFEPNILAYGALVLTDISLAATLLFAVFSFYLWISKRKLSLLFLAALATGLSLLSKASGIVILPILVLLAIGDTLVQRTDLRSTFRLAIRNLLAVAVIFIIAFGVLWLGYGMRFAASPGHPRVDYVPQNAGLTTRTHFAMKRYHLLPEAYLDGFAAARGISNNDGPSFVAGKFYPRSPWFATPFYLSIRNTSAMLALYLIGVVGIALAFSRRPREWLFLLLPPALYLAICMHSSLLGGIRYLLPAVPFLLIAAAAGCVELTRSSRWVQVLVFCLVVLHALSSLRAYPNYLSYANELWGGSEDAYKYVSWPDIGQSYIEAKTYLQRHPSDKCWYLTPFQWSPQLYGVPCNAFGLYVENQIPSRVQGTVIVSSTLFNYSRPSGVELAAPFRNVPPNAKIGGSALLVYEGDFDTSFAASLSESQMMHRDFSAGQISSALEHGRRSVEFAPNSVVPHYDFCTVLADAGQTDSALQECSTAQRLVNSDPFRGNPVYNAIRIAIDNALKKIGTPSR